MQQSKRVKLTKKAIKDAFLTLMNEHPLSRISVTDICERADVNRSTFYAYYDGTEPLLREIENDVIAEIPDLDTPVGHDPGAEFPATLSRFFEFVRQNENCFRVLLKSEDRAFNERLLLTVMTKYGGQLTLDDVPMTRYAYIYCIHGVIGAMKAWIDDGFSMPSRQFSDLVLQMSVNAAAVSENKC